MSAVVLVCSLMAEIDSDSFVHVVMGYTTCRLLCCLQYVDFPMWKVLSGFLVTSLIQVHIDDII